MNIDAKILSKSLANQIQQQTKSMIHLDLVGFLLRMQSWLNIQKLTNIMLCNRLKNKNHKIISIDKEKCLTKPNSFL